MIRLNKILLAGTAGASLVLAGEAFAQATDGELGTGDGASSTGTATITVTKQQSIQITQLTDLTLSADSAQIDEALPATDNVCVNSSDDAFTVTASSEGGFALTGAEGTTGSIPYTLQFGDTEIAGGTAVTQTGGTAACEGEESSNTQYSVTVTPEAFNAAESGTYTDTLTLIVGFE